MVEHFWFNHLTTPCCLNSVQTPSEHAVGTLFERMCSASGSEQAILERFWAILSIFEPAGGHQKCSNTSSAWCWNTLCQHLLSALVERSTTSSAWCWNQVFNHRSTGSPGPLRRLLFPSGAQEQSAPRQDPLSASLRALVESGGVPISHRRLTKKSREKRPRRPRGEKSPCSLPHVQAVRLRLRHILFDSNR